MPYPNEHAQRIEEPDRFVRIRRENDKFGPGIHALWGIDKAGKSTLQAIRFDKTKHSPEKARAYLKEHKYPMTGFEPARESNFSEPPEWIPVFKTGTHTDSEGREKKWTEGDLDYMVSSYDPDKHEAPVVIGHPKNDSPAWAWTERLKRQGELLFAKIGDYAPEFMRMLKEKRFKKRSVSVYKDGSLKHIGFLGAVPPAIKGLPDVAYNEDKQILTFETELSEEVINNHSDNNKLNRKEVRFMTFQELMEKVKGLIKADGGIIVEEPGGKSYTEAELKGKVEEGLKLAQADYEEKEKKIKTELDKEKKARADEKSAGLKTRVNAFCEKLTKEGKLPPAIRKVGMGLENFLEKISTIETTVEYSEGDEKKTQTPLEFMETWLNELPKSVVFKEVAGEKKNIPTGVEAQRDKAIKDYMEKHPNADTREVYIKVSDAQPELFQQT